MAWDRTGLTLAVLLLAIPLTGFTEDVISVGNEEDEGPAEDVDLRIVHDFTDTQEAVRQDVEIPADSGPYDVHLRIEPPGGSGTCAVQEAEVALLDPNGTEFADASTTLTATGAGESCGATTERTDVELEAGTWTARFSGNGSARGVVTIQN